jgi:hypothetical protein
MKPCRLSLGSDGSPRKAASLPASTAKISGDDNGSALAGVHRHRVQGHALRAPPQLSKGTLTAHGLLPERAHDTPIAITGGTRAPTARAAPPWSTHVSQKTSEFTLNLLP